MQNSSKINLVLRKSKLTTCPIHVYACHRNVIVRINKSLFCLYNGHADQETGSIHKMLKLARVKHFFPPQLKELSLESYLCVIPREQNTSTRCLLVHFPCKQNVAYFHLHSINLEQKHLNLFTPFSLSFSSTVVH